MTVLALDASTARATVAVIRSGRIAEAGKVAQVGEVVAEVTVAERSEHVEPLLPAVLALLAPAITPAPAAAAETTWQETCADATGRVLRRAPGIAA